MRLISCKNTGDVWECLTQRSFWRASDPVVFQECAVSNKLSDISKVSLRSFIIGGCIINPWTVSFSFLMCKPLERAMPSILVASRRFVPTLPFVPSMSMVYDLDYDANLHRVFHKQGEGVIFMDHNVYNMCIMIQVLVDEYIDWLFFDMFGLGLRKFACGLTWKLKSFVWSKCCAINTVWYSASKVGFTSILKSGKSYIRSFVHCSRFWAKSTAFKYL